MALSMRVSIYSWLSLFDAKTNQRRRYEKITDYDFGSLIRTAAMKEGRYRFFTARLGMTRLATNIILA